MLASSGAAGDRSDHNAGMKWRRRGKPYEFRELGSFEFKRLCLELLAVEAEFDSMEWREHAFGQAVMSDRPVMLGEHQIARTPTLVVIDWIDDAYLKSGRHLIAPLEAARAQWPAAKAESVVILTNASADEIRTDDAVETTLLGASELTTLVRGSPRLRLRVPSVLGVCRLDDLVDPPLRQRSTGDFHAAAELAGVFVPTRAYSETLNALERYHFAFLTGPPEMGKTATARMVGLAKLTAGWEMHECIRPADLWQSYARDRRQVFVADDAFGSTEYRPEAAERWALDLDRILRSMDESHWLLWTSRPAPLKAALRRIHREHGVERFPAPAQVQVDAASLEIAEKALILYRHARAARLPSAAVNLVQAHGWHIVSHPHFTPERIRRLVGSRLQLEGTGLSDQTEINAVVDAQIREPTPAMAASFRALAPEHRAVLVAMLDTPPGPVPERELVASVRRHLHEVRARAPAELIDRLTDHFLRVIDPSRVGWVHPSWRDLVIEELATDTDGRRAFLRDCSVEGFLLALSTGGGVTGERSLPLLIDDADWDLVADHAAGFLSELDDPAIVRLLTALSEAHSVVSARQTAELVRRLTAISQAPSLASERQTAELEALAGSALEQLARRWNSAHRVIPVGILAVWFELASQLRQRLPEPELAPTWVEHLPTERVDISDQSDLTRVDDWLALAALIRARAPQMLAAFGFPERQAQVLQWLVIDARSYAEGPSAPPLRDLLVPILRRLADLAPEHAVGARAAAKHLDGMSGESQFEPSRHPARRISTELRAILDAPPSVHRSEEQVVARVLRDL